MSFSDLNDAVISQVRQAADIVDFIGQVTPLKLAGKSYKGLCPFHREKTPSFTVDRGKGLFYCFGCGTGGDVFKFLTLTERFTRIDPQMIDYRIRVEDPVTYTAPFTIRYTITQQPNYQLYEYSCHEGNGAVGNALSGERAYEKAVAEAIAKGLPIPTRAPAGMEVYTGAPVEGREAVREFGTGK